MYELSYEECRRRIDILRKMLEDGEWRAYDDCECAQKARSRQEELLSRYHQGDGAALDQLLEYFSGCIQSWARDIYPQAEGQTCFKAQLVANLIARGEAINDANFARELHDEATRVALTQTEHVLQWHERREQDLVNEKKPIANEVQAALLL